MTAELKFQTEPREHQRIGLNLSSDKKIFALLMEQGTGKTKVALDTAVNLYIKGKIQALLVVAPSGVDYSWVKEEIPKHILTEIITVTRLYKSKTARNTCDILGRKNFIKKSGVFKIIVMMPEALLTKAGQEFATEFLRAHVTMMVVDESGKLLKNHKAARTKMLIKIGKLAKYRRILTGTPVTKSPLDLFAQFWFLDPEILGFNNYFSFRNYFSEMVTEFAGGRSFQKIIGYKNEHKLEALVAPHSYRVLKKDCLDLPNKIYQKVFYELDKEQQRIYNEIKENDLAFPDLPHSEEEMFKMLSESKDTIITDNILKKLLRLQQVVGGYAPLENGKIYSLFEPSKNPRIQALLDAVEEIPGKIIIWSRFVTEIKELNKILGEKSVAYYGEMTTEDRNESMTRFKTDENMRFLIANQSMGYGWTCNEATCCVYYSNNFNLEHRLQSEDRCHRMGQTKTVIYIDIVAEDTVDEHILKNLAQKMQYSKMLDNLNRS